MARIDINTIENVEGKYHLMFAEGRNMVDSAKSEIRKAWLALLAFSALIILFVVISGFNIFYLGFVLVFLIGFLVAYCLYKRQKRVGRKQCIYAVQNSHTSEIVAKQVDNRKASKLVGKSVGGKLDKYDKAENKPQKKLRKQKQKQLTRKIRQFGSEELKK